MSFYPVKPRANYVQKLAEHKDLGQEAWITWDAGAEVYELFLSDECSDYIGCADTIEEAKQVARDYFNEQMS